MNPQLTSIRKSIAKFQAEIKAVEKSLEPADVLEAALRERLERYNPAKQLVSKAADALATGLPVSMLPGQSEMAPFLLGVMIQQIGVGTIISEAQKQAAERTKDRRRMGLQERNEALESLRYDLYCLELGEQEVIGDEEQRPEVNGAALLNIPADVARDRGLI